eukprot:3935803-Rhodomonas_salina.4
MGPTLSLACRQLSPHTDSASSSCSLLARQPLLAQRQPGWVGVHQRGGADRHGVRLGAILVVVGQGRCGEGVGDGGEDRKDGVGGH